MNFEAILNQIFQPYFYYSVLSLVISFVCIKAVSKFTNLLGQKTKSLMYLIPLTIPFIVMLIFVPSTTIQTHNLLFKAANGGVITGTSSVTATGPINAIAANLPFQVFPNPSFVVSAAQISTASMYSVTGILCLIGLVAGGFFALSMLAADDRVARKVLQVISLSPDEHQWLQTKVIELSIKLSIATPKIGLVEDLRPNAFTIGYGDTTTIVFSIGLLNILDPDEIAAVAAHELGHVKHHDFFYKTVTSALTVISFFNPLAYIASSSGQREREMYADEIAIKLSDKPAAFGNALAKICKAIENLPRDSFFVTFSSNLLVTSSVLHRLGILSTHPRLDKRLRNISEPKQHDYTNHRKVFFGFVLTLVLLCSAIAVSFAMVNIQTDYTAAHQINVPSVVEYKTTGTGYDFAGLGQIIVNGEITGNSRGPYFNISTLHNMYTENGNNAAVLMVNNRTIVNSQMGVGPMGDFFVVSPQNTKVLFVEHY